MSLTKLVSRITRRGSRTTSKTDRQLADARLREALRQQKRRDVVHQDYRADGDMAGGGF